MTDAVGHNLVRLGPPGKGDVIHRADCRYALAHSNARPWIWAEGRPLSEWTILPWFRACRVCRPDLPDPRQED